MMRVAAVTIVTGKMDGWMDCRHYFSLRLSFRVSVELFQKNLVELEGQLVKEKKSRFISL